MIALLQRVDSASVFVSQKEISKVGHGLLIFLAVSKKDKESDADLLWPKIRDLRIFEDENGKMNLSLRDTQGAVLLVPQFTLLAETEEGRRPSFSACADGPSARSLCEYFAKKIREDGVCVREGAFGQHMNVLLENNGPATFILKT